MPYDSGNPAPYENFAINGDCFIAQRGWGITALPANAFFWSTTDMFSWGAQGVSANTVEVYNEPTETDHPLLPFRGAALHARNIGVDAGGAGDQQMIRYAIEGYNVARFFVNDDDNFAPFCIQFSAKCSLPGIYGVTIANNALTRQFCTEIVIPEANVYQPYFIPIGNAGYNPTGAVWAFTNSASMLLFIGLNAGANFRTTQANLNRWQTVAGPLGPLFTPNQTQMLGTDQAEFALTDLDVHAGLLTRTYPRQLFSEALLECQRYWWSSFPYATDPASNTLITNGPFVYMDIIGGGANNGLLAQYPVPMRTNPTVTFYNPSAAGSNWRNFTLGANSGVSSAFQIGERNAFLQNAAVAGDTVGDRIAVHAEFNARM